MGISSEALARCGLVGPYQPATGLGNPVDSVVVADFKGRFRQHALAQGGRRAVQLGAVPFVERVRQLLRGIRARAMDVLRLDPDGGSFEVGRLRVFEREREYPRGPVERACGREAMQPSSFTNPGASTMRHHREAAEQGLA
jgi:hypothetical protein